MRRGWRLTKVAWTLIRHDRTMLLLAFLGVAGATAISLLVLSLGGYFSGSTRRGGLHLGLLALIAYYPTILVSTYFNVALAGAASAALDGESMDTREALLLAEGKRGAIAGWSLITAIVGLVIAEIASRLPGGWRIFGWLAGAAWGLATIFVVPILAIEGSGPLDAAKRSAGIVKRRWGEGVTGNVAIGAWGSIASIPCAIAFGLGVVLIRNGVAAGVPVLVVGLAGLVVVSTVLAATRQVFAVALYRFAIDAPIGGFDPLDLENPFTGSTPRNKRKSWILRICVPILAIFFLLAIGFAIFGHRRDREARPMSTSGDFYLYHSIGHEPHIRAGSAVLYRGHRIGEVTGASVAEGMAHTNFHVRPEYIPYVEAAHGHVIITPHGKAICIGTNVECPRRAPTADKDSRA